MNTLTAKRLYDHKFYVIEVRAGDVLDESVDDAVDEIDEAVDEKAEESI